MSLSNPYKRICRPRPDGSYHTVMSDTYLLDQRYAENRTTLVRAFELLQKDLFEVFDYIEPCDHNKCVYSHRLYSLLFRACTEFESNAKDILQANGYQSSSHLNIKDYFKLENATRLSDYKVILPIWDGNLRCVQPFLQWKSSHSLSWYDAYNNVKHNRNSSFSSANLKNTLNAIAGTLAILVSQFNHHAFDAYGATEIIEENNPNSISNARCAFIVELPQNWSPDETYSFQWHKLKNSNNPFAFYNF